MATHLTNAFENKILDHIRGGTAWTQPTSLTVGLFTAVSDFDAGTVTEVSTAGGHYARQTVTLGAPSTGVAGYRSTNTAALTFPQNTSGSSLGTVTHYGIYENNTTLLAIVPLDASFNYVDQGQPEFAIGQMGLELQDMTNYGAQKVLDHLRGGTAWSQPVSLDVGLFTAVANAYTSSVTEVAGGSGYARQTVAFGATSSITNGRRTASTAEELFGENTGATLGTVTHLGVHDGTGWFFIDSLTSSFEYVTGVNPRFPAGSIYIEQK